MSARSAVVFGDSVTWGQGLLDTHKLGTLVASGLSPAGELVVDMRAHSGAVVGAPDLVELAAVDGEVPVGLPSIFEQVESFQPSHPPALVIVNGGINDVDIRRLLNPFMDIGHLRALTRRYCGDRMRLLLNLLRARIEDVPIVVVGYYPVLSTESHPFRMPFLLAVNGVGLPLFVPHELVFAKIVTQCEVFWEESDRALQRAVDTSNADAGDSRATLVTPGFTRRNATFAPEPWLWGLNGDFTPQDEVIVTRRASCVAAIPEFDVFAREQCFRASAGHPNIAGAQAYATAILAVVQP